MGDRGPRSLRQSAPARSSNATISGSHSASHCGLATGGCCLVARSRVQRALRSREPPFAEECSARGHRASACRSKAIELALVE
eukprot:9276937-Alexandrium_andersonii.AAC.1